MANHINQKKVTRKALAQHGFNEVEKVVDSLVLIAPQLALGLYVAKSLVGYAMVRHQEELNQLVEFIRDNPREFRSEIVESEEFQDAFVLHLESYVKLRTETKRILARQILLGLTRSSDKKGFPLERLQDTLSKISEPALGFIAFVDHEIVPRRRSHIEKQVDQSNLEASDKSREWWIADHDKARAISKDIELFVQEKYRPPDTSSTHVLKRAQVKRENIYDAMSELVQLGVMATTPPIPTFDGGGRNDYRFTKFGFEFITYVKNSDFTDLFLESA